MNRVVFGTCILLQSLTFPFLYIPASMLGGTIFVLTGTVSRNKSGPGIFVAFILAGIVALLNALNYAELSCRFPKVRQCEMGWIRRLAFKGSL